MLNLFFKLGIIYFFKKLFNIITKLYIYRSVLFPVKIKKNKLKKIKSFLIAVPPLQEQQRIVTRANELKKLCDALEARLQSAEEERGRLVAAVMSTVGG